MVIACDGESALFKALQGDREYFHTSSPSFDLISRILLLREQLQAQLIPTHVKGHQDNLRRPLTDLEQLNVRMDKLAKEILQYSHDHNSGIPDALPSCSGSLPQVDFQNTPVVTSLAASLIYKISEGRLRDYWDKKG